jgi:gluconolactonase
VFGYQIGVVNPLVPIDRFEIFATGLDHPECIAFDRAGNLFAGGEAGQVYRVDPSGKVEIFASDIEGFTGGIALAPNDDGLIVCNPAHGLLRVDTRGKWSVFATHAGSHKMICPNFPVFDRHGHLYVSDSGQWKKGNGALLRFAPDGSGEIVAGPLGYANGLALTGDDEHLYLVESDTDRVLVFDIKPDGMLGPARIFAENAGRLPDGLALDSTGNLYIACYASDEILRFDPSGKTRVQLAWDPHAILVSRPTNVAFGGPGFDELYVANFGRQTISRATLGVKGQKLVNLL